MYQAFDCDVIISKWATFTIKVMGPMIMPKNVEQAERLWFVLLLFAVCSTPDIWALEGSRF